MSTQVIPLPKDAKEVFGELFEKIYSDIATIVRQTVREELEAKDSETKKATTDKYIKAKDVAIIICCPVGSVYQLVHQEKIPHIKMGPKKLLFSVEEVRKWLEKGEFKPYKPK